MKQQFGDIGFKRYRNNENYSTHRQFTIIQICDDSIFINFEISAFYLNLLNYLLFV